MPDQTVFERRELDGCVVLGVHGEVDMVNAPEFRAALLEAGSGDKLLTIDLSDCRYLDSSGLAALIGTYRALGERRLPLIVPAGSFLRRLVTLAGLDRIFVLHETLQDVSPDGSIAPPNGAQ